MVNERGSGWALAPFPFLKFTLKKGITFPFTSTIIILLKLNFAESIERKYLNKKRSSNVGTICEIKI